MSKRAVFLDIDGTLLPRGAEGPVDRDVQVLRRIRALGHHVFINTGRSYGFIPECFIAADYLDGFLCGCGCHLVMHGQTVFACSLSREALRAAAGMVLSQPGKHMFFEGETRMLEIGDFREPCAKITHEDDFDTVYRDEAVTKLTGTTAVTDDECRILSPWMDIVSWPDWYEAIPKGHNKGKGLIEVCRQIGVDVKDSIAIGDGTNDLDMLHAAGVAVAMGNASADAIAASDMVTGLCGKGGVADALEKLIPEARE